MKSTITITGRIVSGIKKGAYFTQLEWVQDQCQEKLGFKPYPGTLNLEIEAEAIPIVDALRQGEGIELASPDADFCSGHVYRVSVMGVSGAIVAPAEDVSVHGKNIIEIIAPISLKEALDVKDGDEIMLTFNQKTGLDS
jgi:CTP-dependent riboflavin kinase